MSQFAFNAASVPHILFAVGLLALLLVALLIRGDAFRRSALIAMDVAMLPWAVCNALFLNLEDPELGRALGRFMSGSWALFGPACLIFLLASTGRIARYRYLASIFAALAAIMCGLAWSTDWVVDGVRALSWGGLHPRAGSLMPLPGVLLLSSVAIGVVLSMPSIGQWNQKTRQRYLFAVGGLALVSTLDPVLLTYGISPYPLLPIPGLIGVFLMLRAIVKHDLLHARGFDRATAYEFAMFALLVPLVFAIVWASGGDHLGGRTPFALALLVPLLGGVQGAALMVRKYIAAKRTQVSSDADQAVERLAVKSLEYRSDLELNQGVAEVLENHTRLSSVQLWVSHQEAQLTPAGGNRTTNVVIDDGLYDWLVENRLPLHGADLPQLRLGKSLVPMEELLGSLDAGVILPLADRDRLVGVIAASSPPHGRMLTDGELQLLREVGRSASKSLTFINLFVEAEERIEVAKELEVAAAVQRGRTLDEVRHEFETCQVIGHYTPAAQFGGDWWSAYELPDERVLVVIGDVTGRGVPAALVSSTAAAACQTAQALQGASCEVLSLLELLNDAVRTVGGDQYEMTSFAILLDWDSRRITYANGGHRFPYLVRPSADGGDVATLRPLVSRGTHLGVANPVINAATMDVEEGDFLVLFSDAAVEARNAEGKPYGDKRLQRVLERYIVGAGSRACKVILDDVLSHCGDTTPEDDLTLVVMRVGRNRKP